MPIYKALGHSRHFIHVYKTDIQFLNTISKVIMVSVQVSYIRVSYCLTVKCGSSNKLIIVVLCMFYFEVISGTEIVN